MKPPKTKYAKVGDQLVAYHVVGEGAIDLVHAFGTGAMETNWDHPLPARFLERLAEFSRLIQFDARGWGASDRLALDRFPTWEDWAEDLHVVLDAVGSERAAIFSYGFASHLAMIFAATYPERTSALIFFDSAAKWIASEDYPWGFPNQSAADEVVRLIEEMWGTEEFVAAAYPSMASDERFKSYGAKALRGAGSPRMAAAQVRYLYAIDARSLLPLIQAPTLVLHRRDSRFVPVEHGRYLAGHITGARLVELRGADGGPWTEAADEILGHIEEFLTGVRRTPEPDRVLATVSLHRHRCLDRACRPGGRREVEADP